MQEQMLEGLTPLSNSMSLRLRLSWQTGVVMDALAADLTTL